MSHVKGDQHLPSELALEENFNFILDKISPTDDLSKQRKNSFQQFKSFGLPSKKIEKWHYSDLRKLLTEKAIKSNCLEYKNNAENSLLFLNSLLISETAINDIDVVNVKEYLAAGNLFSSSFAPAKDDIITNLNTAFSNNGWIISVKENSHVKTPIELEYNVSDDTQLHCTHEINIEKNAKVFFVEKYQDTEKTKDTFATSTTRLDIGENSDVVWFIFHDTTNQQQLSRFEANLGKNSKLTLFYFNIKNNNFIRQEILVNLNDSNANFQLRAINLLSGDSHNDLTMEVKHKAENTISKEIIHNILSQNAKGIFQGVIKVAKEAQKTDAKMNCNSLLISDTVEFNAKPELEIFAEDVACGHGATVSEINKNHLFYLMARGIEKDIARSLIVKAFIAELLEDLKQEEQIEILLNYTDKWLLNNL